MLDILFQYRAVRLDRLDRLNRLVWLLLSDSESELPDFLLVVKSCQRSGGSENYGHGGFGLRLDDSRDCGSQQEYTVSQGQLGSVVPVFFDQIP